MPRNDSASRRRRRRRRRSPAASDGQRPPARGGRAYAGSGLPFRRRTSSSRAPNASAHEQDHAARRSGCGRGSSTSSSRRRRRGRERRSRAAARARAPPLSAEAASASPSVVLGRGQLSRALPSRPPAACRSGRGRSRSASRRAAGPSSSRRSPGRGSPRSSAACGRATGTAPRSPRAAISATRTSKPLSFALRAACVSCVLRLSLTVVLEGQEDGLRDQVVARRVAVGARRARARRARRRRPRAATGCGG